MSVVDVEENIKKIRMKIEQLTQDVFRLQGRLQTFEEFKEYGLKTINLSNNPSQEPQERDSGSSIHNKDNDERITEACHDSKKFEISPEMLAMGAKMFGAMQDK